MRFSLNACLVKRTEESLLTRIECLAGKCMGSRRKAVKSEKKSRNIDESSSTEISGKY